LLLDVQSVRSGYEGSEVIRGISLNVDNGEFVAILGPNGAGKSTLLKTIMGLLRSQKGSILFETNDISRQSTDRILRMGIAFVPQGKSFHPQMSVEDNLEMGAYAIKSHSLINERLNRVFEIFPRLLERKKTEAGMLSGGEQQMLTMGRSLMLDPKLLMLDEPSMGLDPKYLETVYQKIVKLNEEGKAILLVEQNARKALALAERAYVIEGGAVKMQGTTDDLRNNDSIRNVYLGAQTLSQSRTLPSPK
jgi:branched-chain amino acid transport system ATP-binding protein